MSLRTKRRIAASLALSLAIPLFAQTALPPASGLRVVARADKVSSITQYGITWTFDGSYPSGTFVNGDYWVKGPLKIVSISPQSVIGADGRTMNGSMLNPSLSLYQGYDSKMFGSTNANASFNASLNAGRPNGAAISPSNPLVISSPASLVSGVSYSDLPADGTANRVHLMAVLTILDAIPPADAFRPPYVGSDKSVRHTLSEVNASLLPKLAPSANTPAVADVAARFQKPWIEHMDTWLKDLFIPRDNMPNYGRDVATYVSEAALMLTLNVDQATKDLLMIRLIQLGLDNYGLVTQPGGNDTWRADGGHMPGRAFPIILAGHLLGDQGMLDVMKKSGQYAYQNGHYEGSLPSDYVHFGEIDQTFFVTQRDVDRTHGLLGTWEPDSRATAVPYETSDIGMAEWGSAHAHMPSADNKNWATPYRAVNSPACSGFVLASRILGIADEWNHPPLFYYISRWMNDPAIEAGVDGGVGGRGQTDFETSMWDAYDAKYPNPPRE